MVVFGFEMFWRARPIVGCGRPVADGRLSGPASNMFGGASSWTRKASDGGRWFEARGKCAPLIEPHMATWVSSSSRRAAAITHARGQLEPPSRFGRCKHDNLVSRNLRLAATSELEAIAERNPQSISSWLSLGLNGSVIHSYCFKANTHTSTPRQTKRPTNEQTTSERIDDRLTRCCKMGRRTNSILRLNRPPGFEPSRPG
jgi:hypothetical protein